jgi:hypothetical protein
VHLVVVNLVVANASAVAALFERLCFTMVVRCAALQRVLMHAILTIEERMMLRHRPLSSFNQQTLEQLSFAGKAIKVEI